MKKVIFIFVFICVAFCLHSSVKKRIPGPVITIINRINKKSHYLVAVKRLFRLYLMTRHHVVVGSYPIAIGQKKNFARKTHQGDKGTPEGIYWITAINGYHFPKDDKRYLGMKYMNTKYYRAENGRHKWGKPHLDLGRNAFGPRFFRFGYPNQSDKKMFVRLKRQGKLPAYARIGSGLGIHGTNDPDSIGHMASTGCIRMHNQDVIALTPYVTVGTVLYITK